MHFNIDTQSMIIREMKENDLDHLWAIYSNSTNVRFIPKGQMPNSKDGLSKKYVDANQGQIKGVGLYVIELKENKRVIGEAGYFNSFNNEKHLELGYIIDSKYWNVGLGSETCLELINFGFAHLHLERLTARMYDENEASKRVCEKCGMKLKATTFGASGLKVCEYEIINQ